MSREIVIDSEDFRHVVKAVSNYRKGRDRIEDTILTVADHIRNGRRHLVDSLMSGETSKWLAEDAMFEELITQILVAIQIVLEWKHDIKYKMAESAVCEARKAAFEQFERDKDKLVRDSQREWLLFNEWKRGYANNPKPNKGAKK